MNPSSAVGRRVKGYEGIDDLIIGFADVPGSSRLYYSPAKGVHTRKYDALPERFVSEDKKARLQEMREEAGRQVWNALASSFGPAVADTVFEQRRLAKALASTDCLTVGLLSYLKSTGRHLAQSKLATACEGWLHDLAVDVRSGSIAKTVAGDPAIKKKLHDARNMRLARMSVEERAEFRKEFVQEISEKAAVLVRSKQATSAMKRARSAMDRIYNDERIVRAVFDDGEVKRSLVGQDPELRQRFPVYNNDQLRTAHDRARRLRARPPGYFDDMARQIVAMPRHAAWASNRDGVVVALMSAQLSLGERAGKGAVMNTAAALLDARDAQARVEH